MTCLADPAAPPRPEPIVVRPFTPADAPALRAMSAELSTRSLYQRFFTGHSEIPGRLVDDLLRLAPDDGAALVALTGGRVVGLGQYVRCRDDPAAADLAVLVADRWQRRGLGRRLVGGLIAHALARGVCVFVADVLADNPAARGGLGAGWPGATPERDGALLTYRLPLPTPTSSNVPRTPAACRAAPFPL